MAAPWSCAVTPSWGPSKSCWSSNSSPICRRNHHHASPRQQRRFPSHPTPCSGDFRDASVDIAHFFTPVEKVGLASKVHSKGRQVPVKRPGQPAELATAYVMLADTLSSYVWRDGR